MKNGQCPKCCSRAVYSNTNRKPIPLNTIAVGSEKTSKRYAFLDTYVCTHCGYVENYLTKPQDLSYIQEHWALVRVNYESEAVMKVKH